MDEQSRLLFPSHMNTNQDKCHAKLQYKVYQFLEQPQHFQKCYHGFVLFLISLSFFFSVLLTLKQFEEREALFNGVAFLEFGILTFLIMETFGRIWSCGVIPKFSGFIGRLRFTWSFYMIVDLFSMAAMILTTFAYRFNFKENGHFQLSVLRVLRLAQIVRFLRADRQKNSFKRMAGIIKQHKSEIATQYIVGIIFIIMTSYLIYLVELINGDASVSITNAAEAVYWAVITVAMVGYGDMSPTTSLGKGLTSIMAVIGYTLFALPVGTISSAMALDVAKQRSKTKEDRIRVQAAKYIQRWWRTLKIVSDCKKVTNVAICKAILPNVVKENENEIVNQSTWKCQREQNNVPRSTQCMALIFIYQYKELAASRKFMRMISTSPLEDFILLLKKLRKIESSKVGQIEESLACLEEMVSMLDLVLKTTKSVALGGKYYIEEELHGKSTS